MDGAVGRGQGCGLRWQGRAAGGVSAGQLQIEADVAAGRILLVHLHREMVRAFIQHRSAEGHGVVGLFHGSVGPCQIIDGAGGDVAAAQHLDAVEVHDGRVVAHDPYAQRSEGCGVRHDEGVPEIGGDELVGQFPSKAHQGRLIAIAIPQLRGGAGPRAVVEARRAPGRHLIGAVVQVAPDRIRWHNRGEGQSRDVDLHRRRSAGETDGVRRDSHQCVAAGGDIRPGEGVREGRVRTNQGVAQIKIDAGDAHRIGSRGCQADIDRADETGAVGWAGQRDDGGRLGGEVGGDLRQHRVHAVRGENLHGIAARLRHEGGEVLVDQSIKLRG